MLLVIMSSQSLVKMHVLLNSLRNAGLVKWPPRYDLVVWSCVESNTSTHLIITLYFVAEYPTLSSWSRLRSGSRSGVMATTCCHCCSTHRRNFRWATSWSRHIRDCMESRPNSGRRFVLFLNFNYAWLHSPVLVVGFGFLCNSRLKKTLKNH